MHNMIGSFEKLTESIRVHKTLNMDFKAKREERGKIMKTQENHEMFKSK